MVTGGSSGIGLEIVRALWKKGATVYMASHNEAKMRNVIRKLREDHDTPSGTLDYLQLDLGHLQSVRQCAQVLREKHSRVDLLFNCAAVLTPGEKVTKDGFEIHLGVNALGPYYLTQLCLPMLTTSFKMNPHRPPRVCFVSCAYHTHATSKGFDMRDPSGEHMIRLVPKFFQAYANSKMDAVLMANKFHREYGNDGIIFSSCNPGTINTDINRGMTSYVAVMLGHLASETVMYDAAMGAITPLYAATALETAEEGGGYYVPWARRGMPADAARNEKAQDDSMYQCGSLAVARFFDELIALRMKA